MIILFDNIGNKQLCYKILKCTLGIKIRIQILADFMTNLQSNLVLLSHLIILQLYDKVGQKNKHWKFKKSKIKYQARRDIKFTTAERPILSSFILNVCVYDIRIGTIFATRYICMQFKVKRTHGERTRCDGSSGGKENERENPTGEPESCCSHAPRRRMVGDRSTTLLRRDSSVASRSLPRTLYSVPAFRADFPPSNRRIVISQPVI